MSFDLKILSGDLTLSNGDVGTIYDTDKLVQDILKICITPSGTNPFSPWYGSLLSKTMIGSPLTHDIVLQVSRSQVENAIQNLKSLQESQYRQLQTVSPFEQINYIMDISITRDRNDFRLFIIRVKVLSKGLKVASADFTVNTI
jgi:phage baseplate assembly protein W